MTFAGDLDALARVGVRDLQHLSNVADRRRRGGRMGFRESVRWVAEQMMEAEVNELAGAELGERQPEDGATHRNGYRARRWDTRGG